jgi:hypothetical protein
VSNSYVLAGYLAAGFIIGVYVLHLFRRGRVLGRALRERVEILAQASPPPAPGRGSEPS